MRGANVCCCILMLILLSAVPEAGAHQEGLVIRQRTGIEAVSGLLNISKGDTIFYTGFEPGDPVGVNVDYAGGSPDQWHTTREMLYQGTTTWMTAPVDSYFCHVGDDTAGYSDGNEIGYQVEFDLTGYGDADLYYLSAMQAYEHPTNGDIFDKFVVWAQYQGMGDSWFNLDPGEGYAWGGDWGNFWYEPDGGVISLSDLAGNPGVIVEFWFLADSGNPEGFGVAIDEILVTGTPATGVREHGGEGSIPQGYRLHPPYPNPFNARTSIRYRLPEETAVRLDIHNLRGQLVRTLVDADLPAGEHIASWDGADRDGRMTASGLYLCRLQAGGLSLCEKVILLR
jgi:hypothetical protein